MKKKTFYTILLFIIFLIIAIAVKATSLIGTDSDLNSESITGSLIGTDSILDRGEEDPADPCIYSGSGTFEVDCSEACDFGATDMNGEDVIMTGDGNVTGVSNIINFGDKLVDAGCNALA